MIELLTDPQVWLSLATLAVLEIVLGIDNLVFLSIVSARLPAEKQKLARRIGLLLALGMRVVLLLAISWIIGLTAPLVTIGEFVMSWRDLVLGLGGLFLLWKGTQEIHHEMEPEPEHGVGRAATAAFGVVVAQIVAFDLVFSLDSVLTAVGMADHVEVMIAAVVIAMAVMVLASEPVAAFIQAHPTVKMLALSFLLLIGMALVAEALHFHLPRGYLYFAVAFSIAVETMNLLAARARAKKRAARQA
ncbi:MAG: TerC family protein [Alphaproteobacteria bacterium]